jgi:hypothetical protein
LGGGYSHEGISFFAKSMPTIAAVVNAQTKNKSEL